MKVIYPVIFTQLDDGYMAYVPDLEINTQGTTLENAFDMARDAIGLVCIDFEDDQKALPSATSLNLIEHTQEEGVALVDVDLIAYRKRHDNKTVRRNVSLPAWLNRAAEAAGLNVSAVLQAALQEKLQL